MRLLNFRIRNYKSIVDSGLVELSESDNIVVFAGQNESGKSSMLKALYDFEVDEFNDDSKPFSTGSDTGQHVSCTYKVESDVDIAEDLALTLKRLNSDYTILDETDDIDWSLVSKIKNFTLSHRRVGGEDFFDIDDVTFNIFKSAIKDSPLRTLSDEAIALPENIESLAMLRRDVADLFHNAAPTIVLFDSQCDLLPDRIYISDLSDRKTDTEGYRAVRNLEKLLGTNFVKKEKEGDAVRGVNEETENKELTIDFQRDWGQRIHEDNQVVVKYRYEKRDGEGELGSYINFYVETQDRVRLTPKQRSKGLIWFLSLWLELRAQDISPVDLVLLLDEPDQHLHVKAQEDVLRLLNNLSRKSKAKKERQIIYATHSPYLIDVSHLSRVKLIINSKSDGTKAEDLTTSKMNTANKQDALQPIASAIGYHVSGLSPYGAKNVILEGISDFYYFTAMRKLLDRSTDYHFVPGIGVRKVNSLISNCVGYGLDWVAIIDSDPEKGGMDSRTKYEEIRDYAFDGDDEAAKKKILILDGAVGVENMFTLEDLRLILPISGSHKDMTRAVGRGRKVVFSQTFCEMVNDGRIQPSQLSESSKIRFRTAFEFIEQNLGNS